MWILHSFSNPRLQKIALRNCRSPKPPEHLQRPKRCLALPLLAVTRFPNRMAKGRVPLQSLAIRRGHQQLSQITGWNKRPRWLPLRTVWGKMVSYSLFHSWISVSKPSLYNHIFANLRDEWCTVHHIHIYIYIYIHFVNSCFTIFLDSIPCCCPQPNLLPAVAIHGFLGTFPGSAGRGELPGSCRWFGKRLWGGLQPDHAPVSLVCFSNAPWKFYLQGIRKNLENHGHSPSATL